MKKQFETESKKILDLMINSIYTNKEIFLRELISNASDALDKRYYEMLDKNSSSFNRDSLVIEIKPNQEERSLTIKDYGIGMDKEDLENNLGIIAKSGSLDFKTDKKHDDISIIGQFGVGFYSAFMVADKLVVETKKEGNKAYRWTSEGTDGYEIEEIDKDEIGTTITVYLKVDTEDEDYSKYLDQYHIRDLVEKYSNYIKYPIKMEVTTKEKIEDEEKEVSKEETLNSMTPIWNKEKASLTKEDYVEFYKNQRYGFDEPLSYLHLNAEGMINYRAILYIPSKPSFDYYTKDYKRGLELYSNGVMIMEKNQELLPEYLGFVKGVVDSEDLSLNISREMLQKDRRLQSIAKNIEKRIISDLKGLMKNDREKYIEFFESFGLSLKLALYTSFGEKKEVEDLLLFRSSKSKEYVSLKEYIENIKEDQKYIYYAAGKSVEELDKNPALQKLKNEGYQILYLTHEIDEFVLKLLSKHDDLEFKSVFDEEQEVENDKLDETEKTNRKSLFESMKNFLPEDVVEVKESHRLDEDASILTSRGEFSIEMEKAFLNQPEANGLKADKVLEINPNHPIFEKLMDALSNNDQEQIELISKVLYDQSRLIAGLPLEDVIEYTKNVMKLI